MGKPRLIILIRHAQSEGNKNRAIHQLVPDHRVKLTDEGWKQAEEAGRRLRHLLKPDDSLQIFTSPYRRTRETTEGILRTLTAHYPSDNPSPFTRHKIKVYEEPRLREQDFGNFQPNSAEMERMWQERADYGHFFYRIPNGESAADAYDRVSGFNESLWRQFGEKDFPSVTVLVTHGLMTRVFLMKWYHWSVEYFEDLRNINHCEFILMKQNQETGKYSLESQLRTWSELKRQRQAEAERNNPSRRNTLSAFLKPTETTPEIPQQNWENHEAEPQPDTNEIKPDNSQQQTLDAAIPHQDPTTPNPTQTSIPQYLSTNSDVNHNHHHHSKPHRIPSGTSTPHEMPSDEEAEYFPSHPNQPNDSIVADPNHNSAHQGAMDIRGRTLLANALRKAPERKPTPEDIERWVGESGMGSGRQADALGDEPSGEGEGREK